jgi:hypothetical protein
MFGALEARLAYVLGDRLGGDLADRVFAAPGGAAGPRVDVGVREAHILTEGLGPRPPRIVPGAGDPRRVLPLRCEIELRFAFAADDTRAEARAAVDAVAFAIEAPDLLEALTGPPDPGFLLQRLGLAGVECPLAPTDEAPARVVAQAEGWFWPVGAPPAPPGDEIEAVRVVVEEREP